MIDAVIEALSAGAAAGAKNAATKAVTDAYTGLTAALKRRFGQRRADELTSIAQAHADDQDAGRELLIAELDGIEVAPNDNLMVSAQTLLDAINAANRDANIATSGASGASVAGGVHNSGSGAALGVVGRIDNFNVGGPPGPTPPSRV